MLHLGGYCCILHCCCTIIFAFLSYFWKKHTSLWRIGAQVQFNGLPDARIKQLWDFLRTDHRAPMVQSRMATIASLWLMIYSHCFLYFSSFLGYYWLYCKTWVRVFLQTIPYRRYSLEGIEGIEGIVNCQSDIPVLIIDHIPQSSHITSILLYIKRNIMLWIFTLVTLSLLFFLIKFLAL